MPTRLIPTLFALVVLVILSITRALAVIRHWEEIPSLLAKAPVLVNAVLLGLATALFIEGSIKRRVYGWLAPLICLGAFAITSLLILLFLMEREIQSLMTLYSADLPLALVCMGFIVNPACRRSYNEFPSERPPEVGWRFGVIASTIVLCGPLLYAYAGFAPYLGLLPRVRWETLGFLLPLAPLVVAGLIAFASWPILRRVSLLSK